MVRQETREVSRTGGVVEVKVQHCFTNTQAGIKTGGASTERDCAGFLSQEQC